MWHNMILPFWFQRVIPFGRDKVIPLLKSAAAYIRRKMYIGVPITDEKTRNRCRQARFLQAFTVIVIILCTVRHLNYSTAPAGMSLTSATTDSIEYALTDSALTAKTAPAAATPPAEQQTQTRGGSRFYRPDGTRIKNRIYSVPSFKNTFPDMNDVQLASAQRHGVSPVQDRKEAEHRMKELVFVGSDPYFHVDNLNNSIPYLVPKAAVLVHDIGRAFFDSLYIKGIPLHKIIVTSVLRTKSDVQRLRRGNGNATENSCHLYGTTVDICYNRYKTVEAPEGPARRVVRNDSLKWVLSEVLRDFRKQGRCHIKYEVKQGCFHLTVN